ncbi:MAG TPA: hypothetical protein VLS92_02535 [Acidimicrobiia bacterium]|nr:hypothetical protein [Acidimicrobiia bacterium]
MAGADRLVVVRHAAARRERGENLIVLGKDALTGDTVVLRGATPGRAGISAPSASALDQVDQLGAPRAAAVAVLGDEALVTEVVDVGNRAVAHLDGHVGELDLGDHRAPGDGSSRGGGAAGIAGTGGRQHQGNPPAASARPSNPGRWGDR